MAIRTRSGFIPGQAVDDLARQFGDLTMHDVTEHVTNPNSLLRTTIDGFRKPAHRLVADCFRVTYKAWTDTRNELTLANRDLVDTTHRFTEAANQAFEYETQLLQTRKELTGLRAQAGDLLRRASQNHNYMIAGLSIAAVSTVSFMLAYFEYTATLQDYEKTQKTSDRCMKNLDNCIAGI